MIFRGKPNSGPISVSIPITKDDGTTGLSNPAIYYVIIQPFEDEQRVQEGITYGKSFHCFAPHDADIPEGSHITDWLGRVFTVRASELWDANSNPHLRLEVVSEAKGG